MRAVIQRVSSASVSAGNRCLSEIGRGLVILVGIEEEGERVAPLGVEDGEASRLPRVDSEDVGSGGDHTLVSKYPAIHWQLCVNILRLIQFQQHFRQEKKYIH